MAPVPCFGAENIGMCGRIFTQDECQHHPPGVDKAIHQLMKTGVHEDILAVEKFGFLALPAVLEMGGVRPFALDPTTRGNPYLRDAQTIISDIRDPKEIPVLKRMALAQRTGMWIADAAFGTLVRMDATFTLREIKQLFDSSYAYSHWTFILSRARRLPPEQAAEALASAFRKFGFVNFYGGANLHQMGDTDMKRLEELLDSLAATKSRLALGHLSVQRNAIRGPSLEMSRKGDTFEYLPNPVVPGSNKEKMLAMYDQRIAQMCVALNISADEQRLNHIEKICPDNGGAAEGKPVSDSAGSATPSTQGQIRSTYFGTLRIEASHDSESAPAPVYRPGTAFVPNCRRVTSTIRLDGNPVQFGDGSPWNSKLLDICWKNPTQYFEDFTITYISTGAMPQLSVEVNDKNGIPIGSGRGSSGAWMPTRLWAELLDVPGASPGNGAVHQEPKKAAVKRRMRPSRVVSGKVGIKWVMIPAGTFLMGAADPTWGYAHPIHRVKLKAFEMAKTLVTNKQYGACVAAGVCTPIGCGGDFNGDDQPVVCVSWGQAKVFSEWVGGRLPSEAEWEYAARSAGKEQKFPWGDEDATCERAIISEGDSYGCGRNATWPVCSKPAGNTDQGLCDMAGNAYEWTQDWLHYNYVNAPADGSAAEDPAEIVRAARGGAWNSKAEAARSANRGSFVPKDHYNTMGFRPARSIGQ